MVRPTHAHIDLHSLTFNYRRIREYLGARAEASPTAPRIIAVIKANAYGHGAVRVARALESVETGPAGGLMLACADIEEGIQLREAGVCAPILVFGALSVSNLDGVVVHGLTPTVSSPEAARALQATAARHGQQLHVHLKVDTGMNRFGFRYDNIRRTVPVALEDRNLIIDAVYTQFATAENIDHPLFDLQRQRFEIALETLRGMGLDEFTSHAANSSALLRDRRTWYDAVRPGLLLYGVMPTPIDTALSVRPVLSLRSRIVAVKGMRVGETAGYATQFSAGRASRVAVIPAGYADGLDLRLAGTASVLVRGQRASIVAVSMDSTTVDVSDVDVSPGDDVVVIGSQGDDRIDACEVARWIGTVPHEILCRTGTRIERIYNSEFL